MASNRFRSRKTLTKSLDRVAQRLKYLDKRTTKTRLKPRVVTTTKMYNKTVTTPKIADNAVTTETIAANAVTTTEIAPGAVTTANINFDAGDIGGMASSVTTTAPSSPNVGDIWFDASDNNNLKRWSGSAWVSVRDATIAVAQSAANAAQTTADGKNKIYRQATSPGTTGNAVGDLWFDTSNDNRISRWDGSAWTAYGLGNAAIANLDAGKITTGFLAAGRIAANTIDANMISANAITATKIAADAIDGKTITGATLQTSNTVNGKIIIDSTNGFRAIASNGVNTVTITTAGTASFTGGVTATSFTATGLVDGGASGDIAANTITDANILSLNASKITAGSINAAVIDVTNLNASKITAGSINAAVIGVTNLNASNITAGTISGRTFQSDTTNVYGRDLLITASTDPAITMTDSLNDFVKLWALDGLTMRYETNSISTRINLSDPTHRMAIDTNNATYALEVGGTIRCTGDMRVNGSIIGGGVLTSPLGASINCNGFSLLNVNEVQVENGSATDPNFTFTSYTSTGLYADGDLNFTVAGTNRGYWSNSGQQFQSLGNIRASGNALFSGGYTSTFNPATNNSYALGSSTLQWTAVWAQDVTINNSDEREKNSIIDSPLGLDFVEELRPRQYKYNIGRVEVIDHNEIDEETGKVIEKDQEVNRFPGQRPRYGFVAQEVKETMDKFGIDFGGLVQNDINDPDSRYSLRYTEFISPMVKAIQELSAKIKQLETRIQELEA